MTNNSESKPALESESPIEKGEQTEQTEQAEKTTSQSAELKQESVLPAQRRAGFFKRIAAMVYDWLAVIALAMLVTIVNLIVVHQLSKYGVIDMTGYTDPSAYLNGQIWFQIELVLWVWLFYAWFWHDGGQTIGMRAWRLKLQRVDGKPLELKRAMLRALYSVLGLGNLVVLFTPKTKLAVQDKLTQTEMIVLTKEQNKQIYLRGIEDPER